MKLILSFVDRPPLKRKCSINVVEPPYQPLESSEESDAKWYNINLVIFFANFTTSYIMILLGISTILYINPYWCQIWFNFIEKYI